MDFNLPPVGGVDRAGAPKPSSDPVRATDKKKDFSKALSEASDVRVDALPATPPPELRAEVDRASARYDELQSQHRELHFASDPESGRLVIEVRDLAGKVMRTIPPSKALDVISGEELE